MTKTSITGPVTLIQGNVAQLVLQPAVHKARKVPVHVTSPWAHGGQERNTHSFAMGWHMSK